VPCDQQLGDIACAVQGEVPQSRVAAQAIEHRGSPRHFHHLWRKPCLEVLIPDEDGRIRTDYQFIDGQLVAS
jgi:hypothetical protein